MDQTTGTTADATMMGGVQRIGLVSVVAAATTTHHASHGALPAKNTSIARANGTRRCPNRIDAARPAVSQIGTNENEMAPSTMRRTFGVPDARNETAHPRNRRSSAGRLSGAAPGGASASARKVAAGPTRTRASADQRRELRFCLTLTIQP